MKLNFTFPNGQRGGLTLPDGTTITVDQANSPPAPQPAPQPSTGGGMAPGDTAPSTLDPGSMSGLLSRMGGENWLQKAKDYRVWYYKTWGRQCNLPGAPRNPEAAWLSDAELAAIVAS